MLGRLRLEQSAGDQDGFSLVEILVTIAIVGVAFAAILTGLATAIRVSDAHRKQSTTDGLVRNAAEVVKDSVRNPYQNCATTYSTSSLSVPTGYQIAVSVQYWSGASPTGLNYAPAFSGSCPTPVASSDPAAQVCPAMVGLAVKDCGMQLVTVTASSVDGQATERVQLIKRVIYANQG